MKLLMFYAPEFSWAPFERTIDNAADDGEGTAVENAIVIFYHAEAHDEERAAKVATKMLKNVKWLAGKFETRTVVLHSFGHLSDSKADPAFTAELVAGVRARLENVDYIVLETPFGWLNEWKMHVAGESLAKVWKDI